MVTLFELGAHDELVKLGENRDMVSAGKGHLAAPGTRPDRSAFVLAPKWFQDKPASWWEQLQRGSSRHLRRGRHHSGSRAPSGCSFVDGDPLEKQSETIFY